MPTFDFSWLDANFVYVMLILGLWLTVLAMYIPGTGVPDAIAFVLVLGCLFILSAMPTNWIAVGVLVLGASSFLVLPFFGEKWGHSALLGLGLQALAGYYLFPEKPVSLLLIGIITLLGIVYYFKVLVPVLAKQRTNIIEETIVGIKGRVVKDLDPIGTIYINKELWRARSDEALAKDTLVVVIAQDGLELHVEKAKH